MRFICACIFFVSAVAGAEVVEDELPVPQPTPLLNLGLRLDSAYNVGGAVSQGFSLPSMRLTAWGQANENLAYRLSVGQAKEFSSALLPLLMPVQAYVELSTQSGPEWTGPSKLILRLGLFSPTFNPWWTPDLADITLPDFGEAHKALFLSRELGAEAVWEPWGSRLAFYGGAFNGTGLMGANTNNSRAFTFGMRTRLPIGWAQWELGVSGSLREQADPGNVNFRSDGVWNLYSSLEFDGSPLRFTGELFGGSLNDSTRSAKPFGGAGSVTIPLFSGVRFFLRAEWLRNTGTGNGMLRHGQFGPVFDLHKTLQAYVFYQYLENSSAPENLGWVRVRLIL